MSKGTESREMNCPRAPTSSIRPYRLSAAAYTNLFSSPPRQLLFTTLNFQLQLSNRQVPPTTDALSDLQIHRSSKMVRIKNRYLLLDILYPDLSTWPSSSNGPHAAQLAIHAPTSDALTPGLLAKMIREEVGEMYGDWGVGKLGGASATGVQGKAFYPLPFLPNFLPNCHGQIWHTDQLPTTL